jgi:hypothetical protein
MIDNPSRLFILTDANAYLKVNGFYTRIIRKSVNIIDISGVSWGDITGDLSDQTDLQDALANKQNSLGFTPENVANKSVNLTSPDNTKYPTTQAVVDGLATKQNVITNPVTGTGANGQVAFWNGTNSQTGDNGLFWDNTNKRLGVGTVTPQARLDVRAQGALSTDIAFRVRNSADTANLISIDGRGQTTIDSLRNVQSLFLKSSPTTSGDFNEIVFGVTGSNSRFATIQSIHVNPASNLRTHLTFNTTGTAFGEGMRLTDNKNVLIGTTTDIPSSKLTVESTTQGFLPPRMTTTQKNAIVSPASGLVIYDTTLNKLCVRGASAWETITSI